VPFGPLLAWKRGDVLGAMQRLMAAGIAGLLGIAVAFAWTFGGPALAPFGVGLACFVIVGAFTDLAERSGFPRVGVSVAARRLAGLPRSALGTALAHAGLGVTLLGIVSETTWSSEQIVALKAGERVAIAGYELKLEGVTDRQGPNYREQVARFSVTHGGDEIGELAPSRRSFAARQTSTTEAALMTRGASQLYASLGDSAPDGAIAVRIYHKPLVLLIWLGAIVMVCGGLLSLSDRRLRVGAPRPAKAQAMAQRAQAAE
jgi:cytochrome c-type biogenesis protein CcmF